MNITKRINLENIFLLLFLAIFPFGQIFRIGILQPVDLVVGLAAIYSIIKKYKIPTIFQYLEPFLFFATVSWIFSIFIFYQTDVFYGSLYLFRLVAYFYFGVYVWNFCKDRPANSDLLLSSLLSISLVSSLLGWMQFFIFPDLKPFFVWGWDMHLFRLVGTFLDPTFLGLIIVFGLILSIHQCIDNLNWKNGLITIFLLVSLAFTYSRASYLAFAASILVIIFLQKKFKKLIFLIIGLGIVAFLLPTSKNHSIELFRKFSVIARIENYKMALNVFSKSPVFGIGYNNMCVAYQKHIGPQDFSSHACSGSDSSILFILATTGILGLSALIFGIAQIISNSNKSSYLNILTASFIALLTHSVFSNSIFYPWITGWMMILLSLSLTETHSN